MSDLISRSALLKKIAHHTMFDCLKRATFESANAYEQTKGAMFDLAQKAPAVDAVPVVHARWVHEQRYGDSGGWVWRCTACRLEAISPIISALHYCNHCGAKMDGGGGRMIPITDKQRELIECMNEFCREKFNLDGSPTKRMAQEYISRNIDEYKLQTASNWCIENGYF